MLAKLFAHASGLLRLPLLELSPSFSFLFLSTGKCAHDAWRVGRNWVFHVVGKRQRSVSFEGLNLDAEDPGCCGGARVPGKAVQTRKPLGSG